MGMPPLRAFAEESTRTVNHETLTVFQAVDLYITHEAKRPRCQESALERDRLLREFCGVYGAKLVRECSAGDLIFWIERRAADGLEL